MTHCYGKALILAGRRWHVRAWCALRCDWRDFVLGRITRIDPTEQIEIPPVKDLAWETYVPVIIRPHSKLSKAQAKVVMAELLEGKSSKQIETRGALVGYLVQEIRASTISDQAPPDYQIEVVNVEEVSTWLFATRSNS